MPRCSPPARSWSDRKSTRLNSSHRCISYAVFCLKKKKIAGIDRWMYNYFDVAAIGYVRAFGRLDRARADDCDRQYVTFFFNGPTTTQIYTLSLRDALPI